MKISYRAKVNNEQKTLKDILFNLKEQDKKQEKELEKFMEETK